MNYNRLIEFEDILKREGAYLLSSVHWAVLRYYVFFSFGTFQRSQGAVGFRSLIVLFYNSLKNNLLNFRLMFTKKVWVFSNNAEVRKMKGQYVNKIFHGLLESDETLLFEKFARSKNKQSQYSSRIDLFSVQLLAKFFRKIYFIKSEHINKIVTLLRREKFENVSHLNRVWGEYLFYFYFWRFVFKFSKPQIVLLTDYHNASMAGLLKNCNDYGIPTAEFQHGIVNRYHPAYSYDNKIGESTRPDFFFYFSLPERFEDFLVYSKKQICFFESFMLSTTRNLRLENLQSKKMDKTIVLFTLQNSSYVEATNFFLEAIVGNDFNDFEFIILPRDIVPKLPSGVQNITIEKEKSFYELLETIDIHFTHFSTTALETKQLKIPTVVFDFDNMASKYLGDFSKHSDLFFYARKREDLIFFLKSQTRNSRTVNVGNTERNQVISKVEDIKKILLSGKLKSLC